MMTVVLRGSVQGRVGLHHPLGYRVSVGVYELSEIHFFPPWSLDWVSFRCGETLPVLIQEPAGSRGSGSTLRAVRIALFIRSVVRACASSWRPRTRLSCDCT